MPPEEVEKEVVDYQARLNVAVLTSKLDRIDRTLNYIFTALLVAMATGAAMQFWSFITPHAH